MHRSLATFLVTAALYFPSADAAVFVVNSKADPGTGTCDAVQCTLREAIVASNATVAEADVIQFAIPGAGPHAIIVATRLPTITSALTIDGYTQPGSAQNTLTAAQGANNAVLKVMVWQQQCSSCSPGLASNATPFLLRGLAIGGFGRIVEALGSGDGTVPDDFRIEGCFIGTDFDGGNLLFPLASQAIYSERPIRIGGTTPSARNVIAGFGFAGVVARSSATIIEGNLIGLAPSGTDPRPGPAVTSFGVYLFDEIPVAGETVRIGGADASQRNVIANRTGSAIGSLCNGSASCFDGARIQGNYVQLDAFGGEILDQPPAGQPPAARTAMQLRVAPLTRLLVGGTNPGEGNRIGIPGTLGIQVASYVPEGSGHGIVTMLGNRFVGADEGELPIRLTTDFPVTEVPLANDAGDADQGPNAFQNYPVVESVSWDATSVTVRYRVDSAIGASTYPLRVEFLQVEDGSMTGAIVSDLYLASEAQAAKTITIPLPPDAILPVQLTATDADGRSSELNPALYGDIVFADGFE